MVLGQRILDKVKEKTPPHFAGKLVEKYEKAVSGLRNLLKIKLLLLDLNQRPSD